MDVMQHLIDLTAAIDDAMYTYLLVFLLVIAALFFTFRTKFVQIRYIKDMFTVLTEKKHVEGGKSVSSFQALMVSTASRVGTGNIAGIATAIAAGGPGAIFWMWIMALFGGASAFIESTLAQTYKVRARNGEFRGGPAYYIQQALGQRWLGIVFAVLLIICFAYGFNMLQSYNMSSAMVYYIPDWTSTEGPLVLAIILAVATGAVIFGGAQRISFLTSIIVPIMALAYIALGLWITFTNLDQLPAVFSLIFERAFDFQAIFGGFAGSAVVIGIKRGLFSNEAGMGSAPNAAASASVSHPAKQGLVQTLSVYIDTFLICTCSAMILMVFYVNGGEELGLTGMPFVQAAVNNAIGQVGIYFITFSIFAFAFSSLIGNYFYAESNIRFIRNSRGVLTVFRFTCVFAVFLGALSTFDLAWNFADITMGCMAIVNIISILLLHKVALRVLDDYSRQRKEGKDPVFIAENIGLHNTVCWHTEAEHLPHTVASVLPHEDPGEYDEVIIPRGKV